MKTQAVDRGTSAPQRRTGLRYGWVVVAVSFATQFIASGFLYYAFAIVVKRIAEELADGQRTPVLGLQLVMGVGGIVMAPVIGRIAQRGYVRALIGGGVAVTGCGLLLMAQVTALWQLGLVFALCFGFALNTLMGVAATTIIVNWFERDRGLAIGLSNVGASLGGFVMAPAMTALVAGHGWRGAYELLGLVVLVAAPFIALLAVSRPPGAQPALTAAAGGPAPATWRGLREPNLWLIGTAAGIAFMCSTALVSHSVAFGTDHGFSAAQAAYLASLFALGGIIGKVAFGRLCDRIGETAAFIAALLSAALGFIGLNLLTGYAAIGALVCWMGLGLGGSLPLSSAILARAFGRDRFAAMFGLMWPICQPAVLSGPLLAAWVFDLHHSYRPAFWAFAAALVVAAALIACTRLPPRET